MWFECYILKVTEMKRVLYIFMIGIFCSLHAMTRLWTDNPEPQIGVNDFQYRETPRCMFTVYMISTGHGNTQPTVEQTTRPLYSSCGNKEYYGFCQPLLRNRYFGIGPGAG